MLLVDQFNQFNILNHQIIQPYNCENTYNFQIQQKQQCFDSNYKTLSNASDSTNDSEDENFQIQDFGQSNLDSRFNSSVKNMKPHVDETKYKTELCRNFEIYQQCQYGKKCKYAHGQHEINQKSNVNQFYRTRNCKLFHEEGYCSYGTRCHFIHEYRTLSDVKKNLKVTHNDLMNYGASSGRRLAIFEDLASSEQQQPTFQNSFNTPVKQQKQQLIYNSPVNFNQITFLNQLQF